VVRGSRQEEISRPLGSGSLVGPSSSSRWGLRPTVLLALCAALAWIQPCSPATTVPAGLVGDAGKDPAQFARAGSPGRVRSGKSPVKACGAAATIPHLRGGKERGDVQVFDNNMLRQAHLPAFTARWLGPRGDVGIAGGLDAGSACSAMSFISQDDGDAVLLDAKQPLAHWDVTTDAVDSSSGESMEMVDLGDNSIVKSVSSASPRAGELDFRTGDVLNNRICVASRLGSGAFGAVYMGRDKLTGTSLAVKVQRAGQRHSRVAHDEINLLKLTRQARVQEQADDRSASWGVRTPQSGAENVVELHGSFTIAGPKGRQVRFFFTLVTRCSSLKLSDTRVYEAQIRARLGTTAHICEVVVLKLSAVPAGVRGAGAARAVAPRPHEGLRVRGGARGVGEVGDARRAARPALPPRAVLDYPHGRQARERAAQATRAGGGLGVVGPPPALSLYISTPYTLKPYTVHHTPYTIYRTP